jgi:hypothetical protein
MKIKTENGEMNVTSQGQGSLNTVLGAVGTAGALGMMNGWFGRGPRHDGDDRPVTRYELGLVRESIAKDGELAELRSKLYTNEQVASVKQQLNDFQAQQMLYNGTNNAAVACIQKQVNDLFGLTRLMVPNGNIAPGWGPFPPAPEAPVTQSSSTVTTNG